MDWIEKLIGISPDGGDGTTEAAIVFVCVIVFGAAMVLSVPSLRERVAGIFEGWRAR
jgi:hypothetical protein